MNEAVYTDPNNVWRSGFDRAHSCSGVLRTDQVNAQVLWSVAFRAPGAVSHVVGQGDEDLCELSFRFGCPKIIRHRARFDDVSVHVPLSGLVVCIYASPRNVFGGRGRPCLWGRCRECITGFRWSRGWRTFRSTCLVCSPYKEVDENTDGDEQQYAHDNDRRYERPRRRWCRISRCWIWARHRTEDMSNTKNLRDQDLPPDRADNQRSFLHSPSPATKIGHRGQPWCQTLTTVEELCRYGAANSTKKSKQRAAKRTPTVPEVKSPNREADEFPIRVGVALGTKASQNAQSPVARAAIVIP